LSKQKSPVKRIEFLAKRFDVFDKDDYKNLLSKDFYYSDNKQYEVLTYDVGKKPIAYAMYTYKLILSQSKWEQGITEGGEKIPKKVRVADFVFIDVVRADPTPHKEYVQWMLTTFARMIKEGNFQGE
jgi:hypothetical protein